MDQYRVDAIAKLFSDAVAEEKFPGAVMLVGDGLEMTLFGVFYHTLKLGSIIGLA